MLIRRDGNGIDRGVMSNVPLKHIRKGVVGEGGGMMRDRRNERGVGVILLAFGVRERGRRRSRMMVPVDSSLYHYYCCCCCYFGNSYCSCLVVSTVIAAAVSEGYIVPGKKICPYCHFSVFIR